MVAFFTLLAGPVRQHVPGQRARHRDRRCSGPITWTIGRGGGSTVPFSTRLHSDVDAQATLNEFFRLCDAGSVNCAFGRTARRGSQPSCRARRRRDPRAGGGAAPNLKAGFVARLSEGRRLGQARQQALRAQCGVPGSSADRPPACWPRNGTRHGKGPCYLWGKAPSGRGRQRPPRPGCLIPCRSVSPVALPGRAEPCSCYTLYYSARHAKGPLPAGKGP